MTDPWILDQPNGKTPASTLSAAMHREIVFKNHGGQKE
jgi:hypothetical protein